MTVDNAGEYYRRKDATAKDCIVAIAALTHLKVVDAPYAAKYQSMIDFLEARLSDARYTGD